jgi:predicted  nucleic acid-binding Zn-ribbon protein
MCGNDDRNTRELHARIGTLEGELAAAQRQLQEAGKKIRQGEDLEQYFRDEILRWEAECRTLEKDLWSALAKSRNASVQIEEGKTPIETTHAYSKAFFPMAMKVGK